MSSRVDRPPMYQLLPTELDDGDDIELGPATGFAPDGCSRAPPSFLPPAPLYSPPPPIINQQQQSSNVVVVNQHQEEPPGHVGIHADDYNTLTWFLFICCLLCGNWVVLLCLFPALIFSCIASVYNRTGDYHLAKEFGDLACRLNVVAIVQSAGFVLLGIAAIVVTIAIGARH